MMMKPFVLLVASFFLPAIWGFDVVWEAPPEDWPCLEITFVFDIPVCMTHAGGRGSDEQRDHLVNVFYQFMDNDADGIPDDEAVWTELKKYLLLVPTATTPFDRWMNKIDDHTPYGLDFFKRFKRVKTQFLTLSELNSCDVPVNRGADALDRSTWPDFVDTESLNLTCASKKDSATEEVLQMIIAAAAEVYKGKWQLSFQGLAGGALLAANKDCGWGYKGNAVMTIQNECGGQYTQLKANRLEYGIVLQGIYLTIQSYLGGLYTIDGSKRVENEWTMSTPDASMSNTTLPTMTFNAIPLELGSPLLYEMVNDTTSDGHAWLPEVMPDGKYQGLDRTTPPSNETFVLHMSPDKKSCYIFNGCNLETDPEGMVCYKEGEPGQGTCQYKYGKEACVVCQDPSAASTTSLVSVLLAAGLSVLMLFV